MKTSSTQKANLQDSPASVEQKKVKAVGAAAVKKTAKAAASPAKAAAKTPVAKGIKKPDTSRAAEDTTLTAGEPVAKVAHSTHSAAANAPAAKKKTKTVVIFNKAITDKLKKIVANYTEYPELLESIERDTKKSFIDELNIDSVDFVEIIVDVEEAFNISIADDEIYELKSFEDLYVAIESKITKTKKA